MENHLHQSEGRTLFDLFGKNWDMFFLVCTNGTFMTKDVARKLKVLDNVTPAISIKGYEDETDDRRGKVNYLITKQMFHNIKIGYGY